MDLLSLGRLTLKEGQILASAFRNARVCASSMVGSLLSLSREAEVSEQPGARASWGSQHVTGRTAGRGDKGVGRLLDNRQLCHWGADHFMILAQFGVRPATHFS